MRTAAALPQHDEFKSALGGRVEVTQGRAPWLRPWGLTPSVYANAGCNSRCPRRRSFYASQTRPRFHATKTQTGPSCPAAFARGTVADHTCGCSNLDHCYRPRKVLVRGLSRVDSGV